MKQILILRHISYTKLIDYVNQLPKKWKVDVATTADIPEYIGIHNIIQFPYDIYFNISRTPDEWIEALSKYDSVMIFQANDRMMIPSNIVKFVNRLLMCVPEVLIMNDQYHVKSFTEYEFYAHVASYKPEVTLPTRLSVSISDRCNLRCEFCYRKPESEYQMMLIRDFIRLPNALLRNATDIELSGYGEVMLNPDLFKILDYISEYPNIQRISFTTNATMLYPKFIDRLITYPKLTLIQISLDTLRPVLYQQIRLGANIDRVKPNIDYLASVKPKHLNVFLKMVLTNDTLMDLISMIDYTKQCKFDRLITLPMHISKTAMIPKSIYFNQSTTNRWFVYAKAYAEAMKVSLTLPPAFKIGTKLDTLVGHRDYKNHPCAEPFETMYIQANGDVYPCCFSTDSYGNLFDQSLYEVWHSKKYEFLRKSVNTSSCPEYCKVCGMTESMDDLNFMIKKGEDFREPNIIQQVMNYGRQTDEKI